MATGGEIPAKVYYLEGDVQKEIRKFTLDQDAATSYSYLVGRIKIFFSSLMRKDLQIYWKDEEGDFIVVSSDAELFEVMKGVTKSGDEGQKHLQLYIRVATDGSSPPNTPHPGVVCDKCDQPINGVRYKCMVCPNFDLCSTCEHTQTHPLHHNLLCMKKPSPSRRRCPPWMGFMRCPMNQPSTKDNGKSTPSKPSGGKDEPDPPCEMHVNEVVKELASTFGFDPNVAVSYMQSFLQQFPSSASAEKSDARKDDSSQSTSQEEATADKGKAEEHGPQDNSAPEDSAAAHCNTNEFIVETESSTEDSTAANSSMNDPKESPRAEASPENSSSSGRNDFASSLHPLFSQFGEIRPEQMESMGKMMENIFNTIGSGSSNGFAPFSSAGDNKSDKEAKKSVGDDFVVVNERKEETSEEERFEKRLNETLEQMQGMGFDNDGDWLKQLLVAKDLDISRVLDAMKSTR